MLPAAGYQRSGKAAVVLLADDGSGERVRQEVVGEHRPSPCRVFVREQAADTGEPIRRENGRPRHHPPTLPYHAGAELRAVQQALGRLEVGPSPSRKRPTRWHEHDNGSGREQAAVHPPHAGRANLLRRAFVPYVL